MLFSVLVCSVLLATITAADEYHDFKKIYQKPNARNKETDEEAENKFGPVVERDTSFWVDKGQASVKKRAASQLNTNKAKNIIMFLGDGMSIPTLAAARVYQGHLKGKKTGEEEQLSFEKFPISGLSKTYCSNGQVSDSACTATAYLCGVKANIATIGVNAHVVYNNCSASNEQRYRVESIAAWAQEAGMATGIVTTTRVTHASPAGTYAHVANRDWESDSDVKNEGSDPATCQDIASQLIRNSPGRNFNVILGGGRGKFVVANRLDKVDLIESWLDDHPKGRYVSNRAELLETDVDQTTHLLGLFTDSHMEYNLKADRTKEPSLAEMTKMAIEMMEKNKNGYFLFVEGGRIDHAHHDTKAKIALDETLEFSKAVKVAAKDTSPDDTLIVVTSDHAHTMSVAGYPVRGNNILGMTEPRPDDSGIPYTVLSYATGPKQYVDSTGKREDVTKLINTDFEYPSMVHFDQGNHAGDDVGIFASGPYSHMLTGVMEQNVIPHVMAYAACIGDGLNHCKKHQRPCVARTGCHHHYHHGNQNNYYDY